MTIISVLTFLSPITDNFSDAPALLQDYNLLIGFARGFPIIELCLAGTLWWYLLQAPNTVFVFKFWLISCGVPIFVRIVYFLWRQHLSSLSIETSFSTESTIGFSKLLVLSSRSVSLCSSCVSPWRDLPKHSRRICILETVLTFSLHSTIHISPSLRRLGFA